MLNYLKGLLSRVDADYADLRYEEIHELVAVRNRNAISSTDHHTRLGFVLRFIKVRPWAPVLFLRQYSGWRLLSRPFACLLGKEW